MEMNFFMLFEGAQRELVLGGPGFLFSGPSALACSESRAGLALEAVRLVPELAGSTAARSAPVVMAAHRSAVRRARDQLNALDMHSSPTVAVGPSWEAPVGDDTCKAN
jgi:hypothetical protein